MLWKEQITVFGNFSITAVRLRGKRGKKEKPTQKPPALQAPPAQRPGRWCGAGRLGWSEECGESSQACAPRPALQEMPLLIRTRHRVLAGTQDASLALPGLQRSLDWTAPGATPRRPGLWLRLCPGARSAAAAARVARAGPVLTCAPSAEQRAESGGAGARHPRGGPCSGVGRLHSLGCEGEGASLCCLFIRQRLRLGIGRQEDVPAPTPLALTPDAVPPSPPRPSAPTSPPLLQRWGQSSEGGFCSAPSLRLFPRPPALLPFFVAWASATALPQRLRSLTRQRFS